MARPVNVSRGSRATVGRTATAPRRRPVQKTSRIKSIAIAFTVLAAVGATGLGLTSYFSSSAPSAPEVTANTATPKAKAVEKSEAQQPRSFVTASLSAATIPAAATSATKPLTTGDITKKVKVTYFTPTAPKAETPRATVINASKPTTIEPVQTAALEQVVAYTPDVTLEAPHLAAVPTETAEEAPARIVKTTDALATAPLCHAPNKGGNVTHAAFRSARVMKKIEWNGQEGITLDTRLTLAPSGKVDADNKPVMCAMTLRVIFSAQEYQRVPEFPVATLKGIDKNKAWQRTTKLFNQWVGCFAQHGFSTAKIPNPKTYDAGLIWPVSAMMTWESARGYRQGTVTPCITSWGRDLSKPDEIAAYIADGETMPPASAYEIVAKNRTQHALKREHDRDHGPAMGGAQLMYSGLIEREVDNPFDITQAAAGGRRYIQALEKRYRSMGLKGTMLSAMVKLAYNHGQGGAEDALEGCGGRTLKATCISNPQARGYISAELRALNNPTSVSTALASTNGPNLGEILFGWIKPEKPSGRKDSGASGPVFGFQ